ncbi:MAG: BON domain-containing protein [Acidobacteriaceae bacterium]
MTRNTKFKFSATLALGLLLGVGCSGTPSDSQLASNVQKKIMADSALTAQPISVAAQDGTITLTGTVGDQNLRDAAAKDAGQVDGVRTVVNNLTVAGPNAAEPATNGQPAQGASTGAAPPAAQPMVIPAGTRIRVRLNQTLSTRENRTGDSFSGTVADPVRVDGQAVIPAGARARGVVTEAKARGRFKGHAVLAIRLETVSVDGRTYRVRTSHVERVEQGKGRRSAEMTGGGAGLGAIVGGLAGGGKGALIGGLVGGGGGAAGSAFTGNRDLVLPAESILTFDLEHSVTVNR